MMSYQDLDVGLKNGASSSILQSRPTQLHVVYKRGLLTTFLEPRETMEFLNPTPNENY